MSRKECEEIDIDLYNKCYDTLPNYRIVNIQEKYLTTGKALEKWKHAIDTCDLSKSYTKKLKKIMKKR